MLEDIAEYFQSVEHFDTKSALAEDKEVIDEALATLQEIMLGMLPEKRDESASQCLRHWSDDPSLPCTCDDGDPKAKGFNTAVKLTEQNIRGGFNNE